MHAGTEQLLTIRDGGPVDATVAQHVNDCAQCADRLAGLTAMRDELRQLPQLEPPVGGWEALQSRLTRPPARRNGWLGAAVAAALGMIALAVWQSDGVDEDSAPEARLAVETPVANPVADDPASNPGSEAGELDTLVSQSRRLEQVLRELNTSTPRVMDAGMAGTIADLQDGIAYIDYGLSYDDRLDQAQSEELWRQRVGLMNTLVQVRGAQLQQISN